MIHIQTIENVADCSPLYLPHSLYLKPLAKMQITVALPGKIKTGKSVSNLEIMEKLSAELKPDKFLVLKVSAEREGERNVSREIYRLLFSGL